MNLKLTPFRLVSDWFEFWVINGLGGTNGPINYTPFSNAVLESQEHYSSVSNSGCLEIYAMHKLEFYEAFGYVPKIPLMFKTR